MVETYISVFYLPLLLYHCAYSTQSENSALESMGSMDAEKELCSGVCMCMRQEQLVDCADSDALPRLPQIVPDYVAFLSVQHARFEGAAQILGRQNMTYLRGLNKLKLIYSRLQKIEPRAFIDLTSLKELDLSFNLLTSISPHTFDGLKLHLLRLDNNPIAELGPQSLLGLTVNHLSIRNARLQTLDWLTWRTVKVVQLDLFNNSIRTLDPNFRYLFPISESLSENAMLDMSLNPLHCTCSMAWYAAFLRRRLSATKTLVKQGFSDQEIRCHKPAHLHGTLLSYLSDMKLGCISSRVSDVTLLLDSQNTESKTPQLQCTGISSLQPPTVELFPVTNRSNTVSILSRSKKNISSLYTSRHSERMTSSELSQDSVFFTRIVANITLSLSDLAETFVCVVSPPAILAELNESSGQDQIVYIVLSGLRQFTSSTSNDISETKLLPRTTALPILLSFYQMKQFTLFHLILVILFTFFGTIAALCIGRHIWRTCKYSLIFSPSPHLFRRNHSSSKTSIYSAVKTSVYPVQTSPNTYNQPSPHTTYPLLLTSIVEQNRGDNISTGEYDTPLPVPSLYLSTLTRSHASPMSHGSTVSNILATPGRHTLSVTTSIPYHLDFKTQEKFYYVDPHSSPATNHVINNDLQSQSNVSCYPYTPPLNDGYLGNRS